MVMASDKARVVLVASSVLAMAACGSVPGQHAQVGAAATPAPASAHGTPAGGSCGSPPPRYAWAVDVTTAGQMLWKTPLATRNTFFSSSVQPVAVGPVAVFAQDGMVRGLDLADGHPLWSWAGGQSVYGMWRWGALIAVLTDQVSNHSRLTGLDAATGAVRWSLRLPARGLLDPRTGRLRWQADTFVALGTVPLVTETDVLVAEGQPTVRLVDRAAADGRVRWQDTLAEPPLGEQQVLQAGPLAVLQGDPSRSEAPAPLLAYQLTSGRLAWRVDLPTFVQSPPVLGPGQMLVQPADLVYTCAAAG